MFKGLTILNTQIEHMKKLQDDEQRHVMADDALKNEMMDLKLQLEEKTIELEQRNLYMVKAKTAIDALKLEIERLKNDAERQNDLEERVRKLKQMNDDIEMDYKQQMMVLENEIQNLNQRLSLKDKEKEIVDERAVSSCCFCVDSNPTLTVFLSLAYYWQ